MQSIAKAFRAGEISVQTNALAEKAGKTLTCLLVFGWAMVSGLDAQAQDSNSGFNPNANSSRSKPPGAPPLFPANDANPARQQSDNANGNPLAPQNHSMGNQSAGAANDRWANQGPANFQRNNNPQRNDNSQATNQQRFNQQGNLQPSSRQQTPPASKFGDNELRGNPVTAGQMGSDGVIQRQNAPTNQWQGQTDQANPYPTDIPITPARQINPAQRDALSQLSDSGTSQPSGRNDVIVDPNVRPVNFQDANTLNAQLAQQILDKFDVNNIQAALPGDPISLVEVLGQAPPNRRGQAVANYWNAYTGYLKMRFAQEEMYWLEQLRSPVGQADKMLLRAAQLNGQNDAMNAELAFEKAQGELSRFLPKNQHDLLPLPNDKPLLGRYRTNFEHYSARQSMPQRLQLIDKNLPKQHMLVHSRAQAVQTGDMAVRQTVNSYNQGQATLAAALEAIRLCHNVNASFADTVNSYNQMTNEYAMAVAPRGQGIDRLASMLIKMPNTLDNPSLDSPGLDAMGGTRQARNDSVYSNQNLLPANSTPMINSGQPANQAPQIQSNSFGGANPRSQLPAGGSSFNGANPSSSNNPASSPLAPGRPPTLPPTNNGNTGGSFRR